MFVAASTRCFADKGFSEACNLLTDLEFDKVELWFDDNSQHLRPTEVASNIEGFFSQFFLAWSSLSFVVSALSSSLNAVSLYK